MFDRQKIDFGVIATGSDARQWVRIKNVYPHAVHISNVRTTCGCSAAEPEKTDLKPGEETAVEVTMNTVKFRRRKDSNVIVTFDRPQRAEVRVPITAYIRTDVVFEPGAAACGSIEAGQAATRTITVAYAGRDDRKIQNDKARRDNNEEEVTEDEDKPINLELKRLQDLIEAGEAAEAFFMARSLFTSGESWAEEWMLKAQSML